MIGKRYNDHVVCQSGLKHMVRAAAFPVVLLLSVLQTGCANSCFVAVSNPGGTVIGVSASNLPVGCPPVIKSSNIRVSANIASLCEDCSPSNRTERVVLTLRGVELHAKANSLSSSTEWLELFPEFEENPHQLDLVDGSPDTPSELLGESAAIPAGVYDQIRLRLVQGQSNDEAQPSTGSACGNSGFNCVIMADRHVQALQVSNQPREFRIPPEGLPGGLLFISPGGNDHLLIQITPVLSAIGSNQEGVRFLPTLKGSARIERDTTGKD